MHGGQDFWVGDASSFNLPSDHFLTLALVFYGVFFQNKKPISSSRTFIMTSQVRPFSIDGGFVTPKFPIKSEELRQEFRV